ncbi:MAG: VWA domain-containing protein [Bryobacteraceae bacterium]
MSKLTVSLTFLLSCAPALFPQQTQPPAQPSNLKAGSEEVMVDLVVRDKKGRAITDLKASDFTLLDNGDKKTIKTFRLVQGTESVDASGAHTQLDPLRQIRLVTLIFENLDLNSRRLARDAALDLLKTEFPQNVYMAVMIIDFKLEAIQPFTNNRDLLRKAIERATGNENADFSTDSAHVQSQLEQMVGPNTAGTQSLAERVANMPTGATSATGAGAAPDGAALTNQMMARVMLDMLEGERQMAMSQAGRAQIFGLLDAVKDQFQLPGRKTILYFSNGLSLPQDTDEAFKNLISIANRNNVSVYCIDARGLITRAMNKDAIDALNSAAGASRQQQTNPNGPVTRDQAGIMDTTIDSMRMNTQNNLATLADSTGGTLIANTNDFRSPLRKLSEDVETYYELTYNPGITNYDGSFHKIAVKTEARDLRVQSRSGYFALPPSMRGAAVINAYEVPLLKALDSAQLPRAFPFHSQGLHFRGTHDQVCDLVVDVPLSDLTLQQQQSTKAFQGHFSYVAIVKDQQGAIVKKFQNDIPLNVPAEKMSALKESHFIYTEHFTLPSGHYRLETAVLDRQGDKISARKASLFVPDPSSSLGISSVVQVRSTKPKSADTAPNDPLVIGNQVITPALNAVVSKKETAAIPFYLVIYLDKASSEKPQFAMEFSRNGQVLGAGSPPLTDPDADGRIQHIASAPVAKLEPGDYQVRFVVKQGSEIAQETVGFTLEQ